MKHKNIKGFTLIEMLVVIAVIGALSVAIGVSANQMMANSQKNDYEETYKEIMKNARIYVEINGSSLTNDSSTNFPLEKLIERGLQDDKILSQNDPVYEDGRLFKEDMNIIVSLDANGKKSVTIEVPECTNVTSDNIDDYEWGKC